MIKIKDLTVRNFMSVGNQTQAVDFDKQQLTLVLGENLDQGGDDSGSRNGTGKTTIINALSYALYGTALTNIRKNVKRNCWQTRNITASLGNKKELTTHIKDNDWNTMHIIINESRMQHYVNGILMSDVTDLDAKNRMIKGYIGVQVHKGPPMKVEYKNIRLKIIS